MRRTAVPKRNSVAALASSANLGDGSRSRRCALNPKRTPGMVTTIASSSRVAPSLTTGRWIPPRNTTRIPLTSTRSMSDDWSIAPARHPTVIPCHKRVMSSDDLASSGERPPERGKEGRSVMASASPLSSRTPAPERSHGCCSVRRESPPQKRRRSPRIASGIRLSCDQRQHQEHGERGPAVHETLRTSIGRRWWDVPHLNAVGQSKHKQTHRSHFQHVLPPP